MEYDQHGGQCCGISHVFNLGSTPNKKRLLDMISAAIEETAENHYEYNEEGDVIVLDVYGKRVRKFGHCIEVSLTDTQMEFWAPTLKELKFKLGPRFLNDNSGNHVTILYYQSKKTRTKRPYKW